MNLYSDSRTGTCNSQPGWMAAQAPWPPGIRAGCSLRSGGMSSAPWDSLNLGDHVHDQPACVEHNRHTLRQHLTLDWRFLRQVHGCDVVRLTPDSPEGLTADACWTASPGMAATVLVADCLPVLLCSPDGASVAAAHAGWRGLAGADGVGVLESLLRHWDDRLVQGSRSEVLAWLGPCIGPQAFEVGPEVRAAFVAADPQAASCFLASPCDPARHKYLANLPQLARQRLARLGVGRVYGNDGSAHWCTAQDSVRFFSHRRDAQRLGSTGRMAAAIWRVRL